MHSARNLLHENYNLKVRQIAAIINSGSQDQIFTSRNSQNVNEHVLEHLICHFKYLSSESHSVLQVINQHFFRHFLYQLRHSLKRLLIKELKFAHRLVLLQNRWCDLLFKTIRQRVLIHNDRSIDRNLDNQVWKLILAKIYLFDEGLEGSLQSVFLVDGLFILVVVRTSERQTSEFEIWRFDQFVLRVSFSGALSSFLWRFIRLCKFKIVKLSDTLVDKLKHPDLQQMSSKVFMVGIDMVIRDRVDHSYEVV